MKEKLNKIFKIMAVCTMMMSLTFVGSINPIEAQSGEGVDVCTWYSANGFKTQKECENWYEWKQNVSTPAWKKKLDHCIVVSGLGDLTFSYIVEKLMTPKIAIATFGYGVISCMFS